MEADAVNPLDIAEQVRDPGSVGALSVPCQGRNPGLDVVPHGHEAISHLSPIDN